MMRTYVVTGAASGIGAALSDLLHSDGHRVITVDQRDADVTADLADPEGRADAVRAIGEFTESIHGIVPCAGIAGLTGVDPALVVAVNFFGAIDLVQGLRPQLEAAEGSSVVLLASNSITCQPNWAVSVADACLAGDETAARSEAATTEAVHVYPATKAALAWWARREAVQPDWIGHGIRINAVAPGLIATPMTDRLRNDPELGAFADAYPSAIGRAGRPEEIAALIGFLLSDASSLLVGSVLFADGGTEAMLRPRSPEPWST